MNDNLNINGNLFEYDNTTGDIKPFIQEMIITKTEVGEELYNSEITSNDVECVTVKEECIHSPEIIFEDESSGFTNDTEHLSNESFDVGGCEIRVVDLQSNKNRCEVGFDFNEEVYLKSLCRQCPPAGKKLSIERLHLKYKDESSGFESKDCSYSSPSKNHLYLHAQNKRLKCKYRNCRCVPGEESSCECNMCEFATVSKHKLKRHIASMHSTKTKKYKCKKLEKMGRVVTTHLFHNGERLFKCTYKNCKCIPGQEQPCKCDTCEFATADTIKLKNHILSKHCTELKNHSTQTSRISVQPKQTSAQPKKTSAPLKKRRKRGPYRKVQV